MPLIDDLRELVKMVDGLEREVAELKDECANRKHRCAVCGAVMKYHYDHADDITVVEPCCGKLRPVDDTVVCAGVGPRCAAWCEHRSPHQRNSVCGTRCHLDSTGGTCAPVQR